MATLSRAARRDVLAATPLFHSLAREDLEALADLAAERRAPRGTVVMRQGDDGASMMVLVSGRLRAGATSADGREATISLFEPGSVLGEIALLDGGRRSLDITAMADSMLLVIERRDFLPFLRARPELMLRLLVLLCGRLRQASTALEELALSPLSVRLARLLLSLAASHGASTPEGTRIRLRLSQRELGAQVAATRESVNKQIRQWEEAGLLGEQDGQMVVRRPDALRAVADGEAK